MGASEQEVHEPLAYDSSHRLRVADPGDEQGKRAGQGQVHRRVFGPVQAAQFLAAGEALGPVPDPHHRQDPEHQQQGLREMPGVLEHCVPPTGKNAKTRRKIDFQVLICPDCQRRQG